MAEESAPREVRPYMAAPAKYQCLTDCLSPKYRSAVSPVAVLAAPKRPQEV